MSQALRDAAQAMLDAIDGTPAINTAGQWWKIHAQYANLKQSILGLEGEQVHTMYASREDMERARFEEWVTSPDCPIPAGTPWDDMRVKLAESAWMAALKGQK